MDDVRGAANAAAVALCKKIESMVSEIEGTPSHELESLASLTHAAAALIAETKDSTKNIELVNGVFRIKTE